MSSWRAGTTASPRRASRRSWMPSKPPEVMMTTVSPAAGRAKGGRRLAPRGGGGGEGADDGNAVGPAAPFGTAGTAGEGAQAGADLLGRHAERGARRDHRQRVGQVVAARQHGIEHAV